jgi:hypothetical protein
VNMLTTAFTTAVCSAQIVAPSTNMSVKSVFKLQTDRMMCYQHWHL